MVDCYLPSASSAEGLLNFIRERRIDRLKFFCLTHPHVDHYLGAHLLLEKFAGRIDRIWRHPGFSTRDITSRVLLAAKIKGRRTQDPEASILADGYARLLKAIREVTATLPDQNYRRVIAPVILLNEDTYRISALRPNSAMLDEAESHIARIDANRGSLLFTEEEGAVLNSLSVVLLIDFARTHILLLGDSQGSREELRTAGGHIAVLKVAHHGSSNGVGADYLTGSARHRPSVGYGIITPYMRGNLPAQDMVRNYQQACSTLHVTGSASSNLPRKIVPGLSNPRLVARSGSWIGVEITQEGQVSPCHA
jgi:beta-lactamase superfamily II metal-dependent hydrolase